MIQYLLCRGPVVGIPSDVSPGDEATLVHNKDRWRGPFVVEKVIDTIGAADSVVGVGKDGVGIVVALDQGYHFRLWFCYQGDDFGSLFLKPGIALNLSAIKVSW